MPSKKLSRRSFLKAASISAACTVISAGISEAEAAGLQAPHARPSFAAALVAWYKFDETGGASAADSSGSGRTATLVNGPSFVAGQAGNALNLDGTNDHVSLPVGIVSGLNDFSIATWVRLDTTGAWRRLFDFGTGTTANMFLAPQSSSNAPRFAITTSGAGGEQRINGSGALPTGVWTHIAVTLAGSTGILYVNGVEAGRNSSITLRPSSLGNTTNNWLGRSQYADPYLDEQIDDFRIYAAALTAAEVSQLAGTGGTQPAGAYVETVHATGWMIQSTFWNARIKNADVRNLVLSPNAALSTQWNASLLGGVVAIKGSFTNGAALTAIPNFARNNRGGRSIVWIRDQ